MVRVLPSVAAFISFSLLLSPAPAMPRETPSPAAAAVLAAEAARAGTSGQLTLLLESARRGSADVQRLAVRALGRLERPELVPNLAPALSAGRAAVRAEAAHALAQSAGQDQAASRAARAALSGRLAQEKDTDVRAAICEALGRLAVENAEEARVTERVLVEEIVRAVSRKGVEVSPASPLLGVTIGWGGASRSATFGAVGALRGLESLVRLRKKLWAPSPSTVELLRGLAITAVAPGRRLALLVLNGAGAADASTLDGALRDEEAEIRRLAVAAPAASLQQLERGLQDASALVRYEALRWYGRRFQASNGCSPILAATRDQSTHVALLALDLLATACPPGELAEETLLRAAETLPAATAALRLPR
ncbi:MAG: hypothetical protein EHM24_28595, partial [Acidobacteria bacterium]